MSFVLWLCTSVSHWFLFPSQCLLSGKWSSVQWMRACSLSGTSSTVEGWTYWQWRCHSDRTPVLHISWSREATSLSLRATPSSLPAGSSRPVRGTRLRCLPPMHWVAVSWWPLRARNLPLVCGAGQDCENRSHTCCYLAARKVLWAVVSSNEVWP